MFTHQAEDVAFLRDKKRSLNFSDPGTGKTREALELIRYWEKPALVIAPMTLMEAAWYNDAYEFFPEAVVLPIYSGKNRPELFKQYADIYVVNTDAATWLAKQNKSFFDKFGILIVDESPAFKHHTSQRSKALASIKDHFEYRHAMTGTPATNRITDIWHQVFIVDDGKRLGDSFYRFQNATMTPQQTGPLPQHRKWINKEGSAEAVGHMIQDITVRRNFDECIDIPENISRPVYMTLSTKNRKLYDQMARDAIFEFKNTIVTAVNQAVLRTKLLQVASGAVYDYDKLKVVLDTKRYELAAQIASERDHSLIFFQWRHQKEELLKALDKKHQIQGVVIDGTVRDNRERTKIIHDFQEGKIQTLLLHPKSAAHGITLTKARATIWPSPTSDYEWWKQAFHRMVRAGQKNKTETILITARDTIEQRVYDQMLGKESVQTTLLDMLEGRPAKPADIDLIQLACGE